jgi:uncharacterized membrane protein YkvA (DUF1232 family)
MRKRSKREQAFPEKIAQLLNDYFGDSTTLEVAHLRGKVFQHVAELEEVLKTNEFIDIVSARKIAKILDMLFKEFDNFTNNEKKWIVGAARYFIRSDDVQPDTRSILGLDDDIGVMNFVLEIIGRSELRLEL